MINSKGHLVPLAEILSFILLGLIASVKANRQRTFLLGTSFLWGLQNVHYMEGDSSVWKGRWKGLLPLSTFKTSVWHLFPHWKCLLSLSTLCIHQISLLNEAFSASPIKIPYSLLFSQVLSSKVLSLKAAAGYWEELKGLPECISCSDQYLLYYPFHRFRVVNWLFQPPPASDFL